MPTRHKFDLHPKGKYKKKINIFEGQTIQLNGSEKGKK